MKIKNKKRIIIILAVIVLVAISISAYFYGMKPQDTKEFTYKEFLQLAGQNKVDIIYIDDSSNITGQLKDGTSFITQNPRSENFKEKMLMLNVNVHEGRKNEEWMAALRGSFILALLILFVWLISRAMNKSSRSAKYDPADQLSTMDCETVGNTGITFDDVAGNEEAKESVKDIVDFLKNPEKYIKMGARMPRGIIFYGAPGTGKTLLAKAVAGEAGVPYYAFSGSDFVQIYVGVGAARVRDVFKKARQVGKCVIFIDEIDALGKKRDGLGSGGSDERSQTLNALLTEMSGFNLNDGIVVIAATNRLDILDEALLRPGRFDRQVEIGLPDVNGRSEILKIHSRNKPLSEAVDLKKVARQTVYFSGAQLENLLNEAAIYAAKRGSRFIGNEDIDKAFYTVIAGAEKKDRSAISRADREITAYHEAGHALVTKLLAPENRVSRVTIIPSTRGAGGFSVSLPPDKMYYSMKDMENNIKIALAGRIAEEIIFGQDNITTGASNDIEKATRIVMDLIKRFGMGKNTGILNYDIALKNNSGMHREIIEEGKKAMESYYKQIKDLLIENKYLLDKIARTLLIEETIDEEQLDVIIKGERPVSSSVDDDRGPVWDERRSSVIA